jgi:hypothetical protein
MIKDQRLLGYSEFKFPNASGDPYLVEELRYTINLSKSFLYITFGNGHSIEFIDDRKDIKIKNIEMARRGFKGMDKSYRKELVDLVDSKTNTLLSRGIKKVLD